MRIDPPFSPLHTLHLLHLPAGGEDLKWLNKAAPAAEVTVAAEFCKSDASEPPGRGRLPHGRAAGRPSRWSGPRGGREDTCAASDPMQPQPEAERPEGRPRAARMREAVTSAGRRPRSTPLSPFFPDFYIHSCACLGSAWTGRMMCWMCEVE